MEARSSDFADLSNRGMLEAGVLLVNLDEENVRDLVLSRDITLNANIEISNISSDRRALKENNTFYLSQLTYGSPMQFRVFNVNDVLQIRIRDLTEVFGSFRIAEMPLCCTSHDDISLFI